MDYQALTNKKKLLDAHKPLPNALLKNLREWFIVELTYTSNAIEGNTLTRQETALIIEKGIATGGKSLRENLEAKNHANALEYIYSLAQQQTQTISERDILNIHSLILKSIDDENAGRYRNVQVRISGSSVVMPNHLKVPQLMTDFMKWLASEHTMHPVALAGEAHYRLVSIHPFVDGNGRTARLLMNLILIMHGYPEAIIHMQNRLPYINSLEKAQLGGSKDEYEKIIFTAVDKSLDIYLDSLK